MAEQGMIAKFFARIMLDADNKQARQFERNLIGIIAALTGATLTVIGLSKAINSMISSSMDMALGMKQFEAETGASVYELQRWQAVAERTNNAGKAVAESIKAITLNQEKIRLGQGGNISGYQLLGIDPLQDPFKILEDLRKETVGLTQSMKRQVLSQVGVSSELIQTLQLTNEQFDNIASRAMIIPRSFIETIDQARASSKELKQALTWLGAGIVTGISPIIINFTNELARWIRINREGIVKGVTTLFKILSSVTRVIIDATRALGMIIDKTIGWDNFLKGLLITIAWLNRATLLNPFMLTLVALFLILEDIYTYMVGGESVIGWLFKKFPKLEEQMKGLLSFIKENVNIINKGLEAMAATLSVLKGLITGDWSNLSKIAERFGEFGFEKTKWYQSLTDWVGKRFLTTVEPGPRLKEPSNVTNNVSIGKTEIHTGPMKPEELTKRLEEYFFRTTDILIQKLPKDQ